MMSSQLLLVIGLIAVALTFDYINGFHDAANSIATVVSTRVLSPGQAVIWAAFFNFAAAFIFGTAVAKTVGHGMIQLSVVTTAVIFVFIPVLGEYLTPQLVGGTRGVMIGNLIVNFFQGAEYTRGAAVSLLIAALIVVLLVVFRKQLDVAEAYGR